MTGPVPAAAQDETRIAPMWAAVQDPARVRASLYTSQWSPKAGASALAPVLGLYGYHTATLSPNEGEVDVTRWGFAERASSAWLDGAREPFLLVDDGGGRQAAQVVAGWREALSAHGLAERTAVVLAWVDGFDTPGAVSWWGPRAPARLPEGAMVSTMDLMPTLVAAGGGTVPTEAVGADFADAGPTRRAVLQEAADGAFVVRSRHHALRVRSAEPLPEACPPDAVLTDAAGTVVDDAEAREALFDVMRAWRARMAATNARERMGTDDFVRLNAQQGYWQ